MTRELNYTDVERMQEIKEEIKTLLDEVTHMIRGTSEEDRAKAYWSAHIRTALDEDHGYLGSSMVTMQDTIDALAGRASEQIGNDCADAD